MIKTINEQWLRLIADKVVGGLSNEAYADAQAVGQIASDDACDIICTAITSQDAADWTEWPPSPEEIMHRLSFLIYDFDI